METVVCLVLGVSILVAGIYMETRRWPDWIL